MIQKISNEVESFLENVINCENNILNRRRIKSNIEYLLDRYISINDIVYYKVICDEENNTVYQNHINIDIYIKLQKYGNISLLNFIYNENEITRLQKLRKNKLEKICTLSKM